LGDIATLERVEKFTGSDYARNQIIAKINSLLGTQYDLVNFNCEHFAELIQNGSVKSKQVGNVFLGLLAIALVAVGVNYSD